MGAREIGERIATAASVARRRQTAIPGEMGRAVMQHQLSLCDSRVSALAPWTAAARREAIGLVVLGGHSVAFRRVDTERAWANSRSNRLDAA